MPQHKRGPWSQTEDNYLLSLVNLHGASNWVRISQAIQTRSPKQCRERFHQNLKPTLNHEPITQEEGIMIEQMVSEMGKRWAEIARRLRGRSDNAVKNWWNGGMNRRRRHNNPRRATPLELRVPQQPQQQQQQHQQQQQQQQQHPQPTPMAPNHLMAGPQQQQPLPTNFPPPMPQQYFQIPGPMYHPGHPAMPHPIRVPSNGANPAFRNHMIETPLPSPSAYSQMSTDGAPPSLISDSSSISARSPHNGASPIELPPLSGSRSERRQSSAPMLQLGVPGSFVSDDFPPQQIALQPRYSMDVVEKQHQHQQQQQVMRHPSMQENFMVQQQMQQPYLQPTGYMPQQQQQQQRMYHQPQHQMVRHQNMHQQQPPFLMPQQPHQQQHHQQQQQMMRPAPPPPPAQLLPSQPVHLPGIAHISPPGSSGSGSGNNGGSDGQSTATLVVDPEVAAAAAAAAGGRETPMQMGMVIGEVEGSPRDKMSLSNLTT